MSALSSLIIVLDVLRDKKGRDWFSLERIWKRTQTAQTQPSAAATSRSRLTAGCCRSRFVVAFDRGRKQRSVAAAGAARRRRERRVAAPLGASAWSVFFLQIYPPVRINKKREAYSLSTPAREGTSAQQSTDCALHVPELPGELTSCRTKAALPCARMNLPLPESAETTPFLQAPEYPSMSSSNRHLEVVMASPNIQIRRGILFP